MRMLGWRRTKARGELAVVIKKKDAGSVGPSCWGLCEDGERLDL